MPQTWLADVGDSANGGCVSLVVSVVAIVLIVALAIAIPVLVLAGLGWVKL